MQFGFIYSLAFISVLEEKSHNSLRELKRFLVYHLHSVFRKTDIPGFQTKLY